MIFRALVKAAAQQKVPAEHQQHYSVKIILITVVVVSWQGEDFSSVQQMNCVLGKEFSNLIQGNKCEFGYVEAWRQDMA